MSGSIERTIAVTSSRVADEDKFGIGISQADNIETIDVLNAAHFLIQNLSANTDKPINEILDALKTFSPTQNQQPQK